MHHNSQNVKRYFSKFKGSYLRAFFVIIKTGSDIMLKLIEANENYLREYGEAYTESLKQIELGNKIKTI